MTMHVTASVGEPTPHPKRPTLYLTMYQDGGRVWPGTLWHCKDKADAVIRTTPGAFVVTIPAEGTSGAGVAQEKSQPERPGAKDDAPFGPSASVSGPPAPSPTPPPAQPEPLGEGEPVLCYVDDAWAYFTTQPLDKQWGDDWDDAPYEHNAGTPYEPRSADDKWRIVRVAFHANLETPASIAASNSPYSVQDINRGAAAWLTDRYYSTGVVIPAGTRLSEFVRLIKKACGEIYMPQDSAALTAARAEVERLRKVLSDIANELIGPNVGETGARIIQRARAALAQKGAQ